MMRAKLARLETHQHLCEVQEEETLLYDNRSGFVLGKCCLMKEIRG